MVANNNHVNTIYLTGDEQVQLEQILQEKSALLEEIHLLRLERDDVNREIVELEQVEESKQDRFQRTMLIGRKKFNNDPEKGLQYLIEKNLLDNTEESIANYLLSTDGLSKQAIGDYLGEGHEFNQRVLKRFVMLQSFHDLSLVDALRKFLASFRLPGESQKIDRVMENFARSYFRQNPTILPSEDSCHILAFSLIMLNTALHNPAVKSKPSMDQFLKMNRGIIEGVTIPDALLQRFYESVKGEAFKFPEDAAGEMAFVFVDPVREGYLFKQGRNKSWARRYFVLVDNCLFYFESPQQKEPRGIIPLEDVGVRLVEDASKHFCFELFALPPIRSSLAVGGTDAASSASSDGLMLKACKTSADGKIISRKHAAYRLCGESYEDRNAWVQCIEACVGAGAANNSSTSLLNLSNSSSTSSAQLVAAAISGGGGSGGKDASSAGGGSRRWTGLGSATHSTSSLAPPAAAVASSTSGSTDTSGHMAQGATATSANILSQASARGRGKRA